MKISIDDWMNFTRKLSKLNAEASELVQDYAVENGLDDPELLDYAYGVVLRYGEASAALSAEMYDEIARLEGKILPDAEVAETPTKNEVAKAVNGTKKTGNPKNVGNAVGRLVKRTGADTMLKNAARDGAQFAWIPSGDTCPFCLMLASNGWQYMSKKALKNGHAEHIHANCDCTYCIRFDKNFQVEGYDPDKYLEMYYAADGATIEEKANSIRRQRYAQEKDKINAQKRANYEIKHKKSLVEKISQHKPGDKVTITDIAIEKVGRIGPSATSEEELELMQQMNKIILKTAKEQNNSDEVAMALCEGKMTRPVIGNRHSVDIFNDPDMYHIIKGKEAKARSVTLSHNHPGLSYFSIDDMLIFAESRSIKTMGIVTNNGKVWYVTKKDNYKDEEVLKIFFKNVREHKDDEKKAVESFLKEVYNMIERNR